MIGFYSTLSFWATHSSNARQVVDTHRARKPENMSLAAYQKHHFQTLSFVCLQESVRIIHIPGWQDYHGLSASMATQKMTADRPSPTNSMVIFQKLDKMSIVTLGVSATKLPDVKSTSYEGDKRIFWSIKIKELLSLTEFQHTTRKKDIQGFR